MLLRGEEVLLGKNSYCNVKDINHLGRVLWKAKVVCGSSPYCMYIYSDGCDMLMDDGGVAVER